MPAILVSGANKGIGLAIVEAILREQLDYRVLLGSRDAARGEAARNTVLANTACSSDRVDVIDLDVSDEQAVATAFAQVTENLQARGDQLAGLVNNAGIAIGSRADMLAVNSYGLRQVSEQFIPLMQNGSRVVNVTSASGPNYVARCSAQWQRFFMDSHASWQQLDEFMQQCLTSSELPGLPGDADYGLSKACANLYSMICARDNPQLMINACTPGYIETDLSRELTRGSGQTAAELGMKQPADGARVVMHLLFGDVANSGHYYGSDALRSPMDRYRSPGSPAYCGD